MGNISLAAFIDIKKAFDSVNYIILLKKLEQYGIRNRNLTLIENYLSRRQQCTIANSVKSTVLPLTCGVPQGSILGPLFFLLYINDCISVDDTHSTMLYADDSVLYVSGKDVNVLAVRLTQALHGFSTWSSRNKLTINEEKTKIMLFSSKVKKKILQKPNILLNGKPLKYVHTYKYLGVTLDEELSFENHVRTLINNTRFKSLLLFKLKDCMGSQPLLRIYTSHVLSAIDYCDILYVGARVDTLEELQRLQNKCLKTCLSKHILTPTEFIHGLAGLPTLKNRRIYHIRNYAFKRCQNPLNREVKVRVTRHSSAPTLSYLKPNCASYEHAPEVICAQEWNAFSPEIRNLEDFDVYKSKMKLKLAETIPEKPL